MAAGMSYEQLPMDWVGDWAGCRRRQTPDRLAVVDASSGSRWTYAELDERANRVANWLTDVAGLQAGDAVCFIARNRIEPIDLYLACGKTGIILAPLSPRLAAPELSDLLARIQPRVLFYESALSELAEGLTIPSSVADKMAWPDTCDGRYEAEVLASSGVAANRALAMSDPFLYIHTGGTTATPKVCVVPHRQMVWNSVELIVAAPEGMGQRRELLFFPLFHIGGWNTFTPIFHAGGCVVLLRQFDAGEALSVIAAERVNHFGAVEAMLTFMAEHEDFGDTDLSSLQAITTAGAPCSEGSMQPFWERGIAVTQSYGQTEAGPSNFLNGRLGSDLETLKSTHDSVGTSLFHCDYRIVDPETQQPVGTNGSGVLLLRSPHNFDGYLADPERTAKTIDADGWVWSGDLACEDEAGYVRIVGRADNMFVSGGENVSPEEIEAALMEHPLISHAGVVAIPDPRWGQMPAALLVGNDPSRPPEPDSIKAWLKERLAGFKVPRHYDVADSMPLTGAGKIDRAAVRQRFSTE